MEREANYVAVGAFILLVMAMAVGFVLWYTDANDGRDYELYEIYFTGSVSGLDRGSPVRYLGVDVGRVRRLSIDKRDASRIVAIAEIDREAPITAATRASLGLQGVTGLLFINLKEVPNIDKSVPLPQGERYPVIPSIASDFDVFLSSLPEMMGRANDLLTRVGRVFSDENLNGLAETVKSLRAATAGLPQTSQNIAQLVDDLRGTVKEIDTARAVIARHLGGRASGSEECARALDGDREQPGAGVGAHGSLHAEERGAARTFQRAGPVRVGATGARDALRSARVPRPVAQPAREPVADSL